MNREEKRLSLEWVDLEDGGIGHMSNIGFFTKMHIPRYDNPEETQWGAVEIDKERCTGCGLCVRACPADALELVDKKAAMTPPEKRCCVMCAVCSAICPTDAITCIRGYRFSGLFTTLGHGELKPPRL